MSLATHNRPQRIKNQVLSGSTHAGALNRNTTTPSRLKSYNLTSIQDIWWRSRGQDRDLSHFIAPHGLHSVCVDETRKQPNLAALPASRNFELQSHYRRVSSGRKRCKPQFIICLLSTFPPVHLLSRLHSHLNHGDHFQV